MSDCSRDAFELALDEARRRDDGPNDDGSGTARGPRLRAGVAFALAADSGGKARFGLALDWTDEPADQPAPPPKPRPREAFKYSCDTPAEIAAELGLGTAMTLGELTSRWREFVWRNHPDRLAPEARERANARVATANALYEQARREFAKAR